MASGVTCHPDVKNDYALMKTKKHFKIMMFRLSDDRSQIIIDHPNCLKGHGYVSKDTEEEKKEKDEQKQQPKEKDEKHKHDHDCWDAMVETLKDDEPRYIVYDIENTSKDGRVVEKLLFVSWCADNCPVKKRMVHAASEDYLKKSLEGIHGTIIQAHDKGDLDYDEALKIVITRD